MKNNVIELTKQLIEIPSYKDGKIFESKMGDFLCSFTKQNFPNLFIEKQYVDKNRYNIFVRDKFPTKLLVVDHIDTVMPTNSWTICPLNAEEKNKKICGLGSSDTKGAIAAFINALTRVKQTQGLAMLWYVDEEYDFKGMMYFVASPLAQKINPQYILSIDGDGLTIGRGCRGIIEFRLVLKGQTGHSARKVGVNVNLQFMKIIFQLEKWLGKFQSDFLGTPTLNVARINSGLVKERKQNQIIFGEEGNRIPDYLEAIIEIRTTSNLLTFEKVASFIKQQAAKCNLTVVSLEKRFDLPNYETSKEKLQQFQKLLGVSSQFVDPGNFGFLDVSLLKKQYPTSTVFSLGAGSPNQAHSADEYIEIANLEKATDIYKKLLQQICGKEVKNERNNWKD